MDRDKRLAIITAMRHYGGSFVKALAECFLHADRDNLQKLEEAFPEEVKWYSEMAIKDSERKESK